MRLIETEHDRFFAEIERKDFTKNKQITAFLKWCYEHGFLDNLSAEDFEAFYEEKDTFYLPFFKNHGITIAGEDWGFAKQFRIGIDPTSCFNKARQCSIYMSLPITSKRESERFYRILDRILDRKSEFSRKWFAEARGMWNGEILTNVA